MALLCLDFQNQSSSHDRTDFVQFYPTIMIKPDINTPKNNKNMKKTWETVSKDGMGYILGGIALDSYRRQLLSDSKQKKLDEIDKLRDGLDSNQKKKILDQEIAMKMKEDSTKIKLDELKDAKKSYDESSKSYLENSNEYNKHELSKSNEKFQNAFDNLTKNGLDDIIDKYYEFLSTLTPDKIVALFNTITGTLILSSFFTVLSIMLSEQIINKINFLENYPK